MKMSCNCLCHIFEPDGPGCMRCDCDSVSFKIGDRVEDIQEGISGTIVKIERSMRGRPFLHVDIGRGCKILSEDIQFRTLLPRGEEEDETQGSTSLAKDSR